MTHRRQWLLFCVFAAAATAGWPGAAQDAAVATDTPAAMIASLQQALVAASGRTSSSTVDERYRAGVIAQGEVRDAEFALVQAELDRTRALAGVRLPQARLARAVGR